MKAKYMCPLVTLFNDEQEIDFPAMFTLIDRIIDDGIDGLVILGSSGEFYALEYEVCLDYAKEILNHVAHRVPVYIGTGQMTADKTINFSKYVLDIGADGVIVVGPYYIGCDQKGVYQYFHQIASQVEGDILIYNYPDRTGFDLELATLKQLLSAHKNIIGLKDTVLTANHTTQLATKLKDDFPEFQVFTGYDCNFVSTVLAGGIGCIGALSNIAPGTCAELVKAVENENFSMIKKTQQKIEQMMELYAITQPFMPTFKYILNQQGIHNSNQSLLPATMISSEEKKEVDKIIKKIGLI